MCGSGLPDASWMPTSGLVLGNCGLFGILLVCTASLSLCQPNSANGQYLQSSQNCHQPSVTSVMTHQALPPSVSLLPFQASIGGASCFTVGFGIRSLALRRANILKQVTCALKKANAPKPSGTFALPQIFPAPTSSNLPHPALPSPWCMRTEYVHAIAMSRFPIRPPDAFCTQFINSFIHTIRLYLGEAGKSASLRTLRTRLVLGCFG